MAYRGNENPIDPAVDFDSTQLDSTQTDYRRADRSSVIPISDEARTNSELTQRTARGTTTSEPQTIQLFPDDALSGYRSRWDQIQASFVDEPQTAVAQADNLVEELVRRITEQFTTERTKLEGQWSSGSSVSTEDLRQTLRRYRSFFDRLLSF